MMQQNQQIIALLAAQHQPKGIKVSDPDEFDGKPENLPTFLHQLKLNFAANPYRFVQPHDQILYALSFMRKGAPGQWSQQVWKEVLRHESTPGGVIGFQFATWAGFKAQLKTKFGDSDPAATARHKLEHLKQGTRTAEEYSIEFNDIAYRTGFNDAGHIEYFKKGLNRELLKKVYSLPDVPDTLSDWIKYAIRFDRNWRNLQADLRTPSSPRANTPRSSTTASTYTSNTRTGGATTYGGLGKPMDVDALNKLKEERRKLGVCLRCGDKGHFARDCPKASWNRNKNTPTPSTFNVRALSKDARAELMKQLMEENSDTDRKKDFPEGQK
jgi:hypothetical protein